jgi:hypothetical protein
VATAQLAVAGCVTEGGKPADLASSADNSCTSLTEDRRKLAVRIDDVSAGRVGPGTATSVLTTLAIFGARPEQMSALGNYAAMDRAAALADMRARETALTEEIEGKQCTAAARAKAGTIKASDSAQYDGIYAGKGRTESWCAQPELTLQVQAGRVSGSLRGDGHTYQVQGQLYDTGELSLEFKRPNSRRYTDDFDATLKDGVLSFTGRLDLSRKGCVYGFAVKRS